ncbi:hypothetical protein PFHG_05586, partial [Plasmodium falciparum HB3]
MSNNSLFLKNIIKNSSKCIKREDQHLDDPIKNTNNQTEKELSNNNKEIIEKEKNVDCIIVNKIQENVKGDESNNIVKNVIYERDDKDVPYERKDICMSHDKNYRSPLYIDNDNMSSYNDNVEKLSSSSSSTLDTSEFIEKMNNKSPTLCLMKNIISLKEMTTDVLKGSEYYQARSILNKKLKNNIKKGVNSNIICD